MITGLHAVMFSPDAEKRLAAIRLPDGTELAIYDPATPHRTPPDRLRHRPRLAALGASVVRAMTEDGLDHYGVAMKDPEGDEFDIN